MPRGGYRPNAGRKPDPAKAAERAAKKAQKAAAAAEPVLGGDKAPAAGVKREDWPFGPDPALIEAERQKQEAATAEEAATLAGLTPLDYMLKVMRDPISSKAERMQAAIQAAPYVHGKVAPAGKKAVAKEKAQEAAAGGGFRTRAAPGLKVVGGANG